MDLSVVRRHTPVRMSIDSDTELLCVEVVGDHSIVLLGLTLGGAKMFVRQICAGIDQLGAARSRLNDGMGSQC